MDSITKNLISSDFIDYLEANGFDGSWSKDGDIWTAIHNDKCVQIKYNRITFSSLYKGDEQNYPDFCEYGSADGLSKLDLFKFQLILHSFDIVPLRDFIRKAKRDMGETFPGLAKRLSPLENCQLFDEIPY